MAKQATKPFVFGSGTPQQPPQQPLTFNGTISNPINNVVTGSDQLIDIDSRFRLRMGDGDGYHEECDMRSLFLIIKTLLKESRYDDDLIYMRYEQLEPYLNRESVINEILNSEDE
jgi:hypothetical protein